MIAPTELHQARRILGAVKNAAIWQYGYILVLFAGPASFAPSARAARHLDASRTLRHNQKS